jgi:hypothetical protein
MLIIIKIINGSEHKLEVLPELTIREVKERISSEFSISLNQQRLMFKGKPLPGRITFFLWLISSILIYYSQDSSKLSEYDIEEGTKIYLAIKKDEPIKEISSEETLNKELREFGKHHFADVDEFVEIFRKEMKNYVDQMSLDDIERYNRIKMTGSATESIQIETQANTTPSSETLLATNGNPWLRIIKL